MNLENRTLYNFGYFLGIISNILPSWIYGRNSLSYLSIDIMIKSIENQLKEY